MRNAYLLVDWFKPKGTCSFHNNTATTWSSSNKLSNDIFERKADPSVFAAFIVACDAFFWLSVSN